MDNEVYNEIFNSSFDAAQQLSVTGERMFCTTRF